MRFGWKEGILADVGAVFDIKVYRLQSCVIRLAKILLVESSKIC